MKRDTKWRGTSGGEDVRKSLCERQLAAIGAIALTYNIVEEWIDQALGWGLLGYLSPALAKRINGVDGKIELIKLAAERHSLDEAIKLAIAESLGEESFGLLKKYRDGVVHALILDARYSIGYVVERRAKQKDVLLTQEALDGLYDRLTIMLQEVKCVALIVDGKRFAARAARDDQEKALHEKDVQAWFARLRSHQSRRQSLPPLPEFPSLGSFGPGSQGTMRTSSTPVCRW